MLRDHAGALSYLYQQLFSTIGVVVRLVITLGLLMSVDPLIGLLGAVAVPGVLISHWRSGVDKAVEEAGAQHDQRARHLFSLGVSAAAGKEIRAGGVQQCLRTTQRTAWEQRHVPLSRTKWTTTGWEVLAQAVFAAGFVGAVMYTATKDGAGPGVILLVLTAGSRLAEYVNSTVTQTQFYRSIWLDVSRRLAWLEDFVAANLADADLSAPERLDQGIRLENVSFHYPGSEKPALEDISLDLPAGKVEKGVDLSHGHWQKIALARGFVRDTPLLLVLDEPTSALDAEMEHALFRTVRAGGPGRAAAQLRADHPAGLTPLLQHPDGGSDRRTRRLPPGRVRNARGAHGPRRPVPRAVHPPQASSYQASARP